MPRDLTKIEAERMPSKLLICGGGGEPFNFIEAAAGDDGKPKQKRFSIVGYTGGLLRLGGTPVVVDLAGMAVPRQNIPALLSHNSETIVGHTDAIEATQKRLYLEGVMSGYSDTEQTPSASAAREVIRMANNGFAWQASIGASIDKIQFVPAGESVKANGVNWDGPLYLVSKSVLAEISFVPIGADMSTSATVAASLAQPFLGGMSVELTQWLAAKGLDQAAFAALPEAAQCALKAQHSAEHKASNISTNNTYEETLTAIQAENERIEFIRQSTLEACQRNLGNTLRCNQLRELCASAIDNKTTKQQFELDKYKIERDNGPVVFSGGKNILTEEVLEAALAVSLKVPNVEKNYSDQTLSAAHKKYKRGIGLIEFLMAAAEVNSNYRGSHRDLKPLLRAAFPHELAASGPSTISVSGILSNVGNKIVMSGFNAIEQEYKKISTSRPVNDFKSVSSYSLVGDNIYDELPAGGKIKEGSLGETSYSNQAKSFAKMLGIDHRALRNDDAGAFADVNKKLGRGGALKLVKVFWAAWLDDSAFFPIDKSLANYDDGATDSVLSLAGLTNIDTIFRAQTNPRAPGDTGTTPLGITPKILLVPVPLDATARNLMNSQYVNLVTATTPTQGTANVWQGKYEVVCSQYLGAGNTNGSDTAWYLLADPQDISGIEIVYLDGIEVPMVEVGEPDFDELGIRMRGQFHFGVTKQEYRCGVKAKGAA